MIILTNLKQIRFEKTRGHIHEAIVRLRYMYVSNSSKDTCRILDIRQFLEAEFSTQKKTTAKHYMYM